jgi:hypothetical protein
MEDRQTQIREGAGLEESKLNVEFIDFLRKWSSPIMGVVLLVVAAFVANSWIQRKRDTALDRAFEDLSVAMASATPSPETLKTVAQENSGIRAVSILAETQAADLYLDSARVGVRLGARPKEDGTYAPEELLTAEQREANLSEADRLYKKILDAAGNDPKKAIHALGAAFGVAAVAEARGKLDDAKLAYERAIKIAEYSGLAGQADIAKKRIESLPKLAEAPKLLAANDLPKLPEPPKAPDTVQPATGAVYDPNAVVPAPTGAPTPAPAPAPAATGSEPPKPEQPAATTPEAPKPPPVDPKPGDPKPTEPK